MPTVAVQAHRGSPDPAHGVGENTLEAFHRARRLGADGVELDVRLAADGAVVVSHDPAIVGVGPVADTAAGDLPPGIPMLEAALDACAGMTVNVEVKNLPGEPGFDPGERLALRVAELVGEAGLGWSVVVSSFWPGTLEALREHDVDLPTGLLVSGWPDPSACVAAALGFGCRAVHPNLAMLSGDLVAEAHGVGLAVATWTVVDRAGLTTSLSAGVDTVITDDVALARGVLGPPPAP